MFYFALLCFIPTKFRKAFIKRGQRLYSVKFLYDVKLLIDHEKTNNYTNV